MFVAQYVLYCLCVWGLTFEGQLMSCPFFVSGIFYQNIKRKAYLLSFGAVGVN
jgi:hypothetical protein